jgi:arabinose-5-phosphate isomerase
MLVEKIMPDVRKRLLCIAPDATLLQAARLLDDGSDMVLVCDHARHLAGVVTKTDIVRMTGRCAGASCTAPITGAMTTEVITTTPGAFLHDVWQVMSKRGLRNIPVIGEDDTAQGILTARDALQTLLREVRYEETLLRDYAMNLGYR